MRYGIVGAGKGALAIIWAFENIEGYEVAVICDVDPDAPAMLYAKKNEIPTTSDLAVACRDHDIDIVFELTGSARVAEQVRNHLQPNQELVPASLAKVIWDLIDAHDRATRERSKSILHRLVDVSKKISAVMEPITRSERSIAKLLSQSNIITINASIEAARLGHTGRAFAVIIGRLRELTQQVSTSLDLIGQSSETVQGLIENVREIERDVDTQLEG